MEVHLCIYIIPETTGHPRLHLFRWRLVWMRLGSMSMANISIPVYGMLEVGVSLVYLLIS